MVGNGVAGLNFDGELEPWQLEAMHDAGVLWENREEIREEWDKNDVRRLVDGVWWREGIGFDVDGCGGGEDGNDVRRVDLPADDAAAVAWVMGREVDERGVGQGWRTLGKKNTGARCGVRARKGRLEGHRCPNRAGQGTAHYGAGACVAHGGAKAKGRALGAWIMAHAFAQQLNVNPWDALLMAVRIAAGKVAYIEYVLGTAHDDLELEGRAVRSGDDGLLVHPDTGEPLGVGQYRDLSWWVEKGELWHDRLARCAKMAVDAGIAAWQVEKVEQEAQAIARVLNAVIDGLEGKISDEQAAEMRALMRRELLRLDEEQEMSQALEGVVMDE